MSGPSSRLKLNQQPSTRLITAYAPPACYTLAAAWVQLSRRIAIACSSVT